MNLLTKEELQNFLSTADLKLKPRQAKLSLPIIQRIHHKMTLDVSFANIRAEGDLIVDGHHRYICSEILKKRMDVNDWLKTEGAVELEWRNVIIDETDYDSRAQVLEHNRKDAERSGLDIRIFDCLIEEEAD